MMKKILTVLAAFPFLLGLTGCQFGDIKIGTKTELRTINLVSNPIDINNLNSKGDIIAKVTENTNFGDFSDLVSLDLKGNTSGTFLFKAMDTNNQTPLTATHQISLGNGIQYLLYNYGKVGAPGEASPKMRESQINTSDTNSANVRVRFVHVFPEELNEIDIYINGEKRVEGLDYSDVSASRAYTPNGADKLLVVKAGQNSSIPENQLLSQDLTLNIGGSYQVFISPTFPNSVTASALAFKEK